ncbi:MAG: hypothetical protein Q7J78_04130 [Clostridiales bacterium]|nr:hypothetical protein [Clostridiales bacterium]
MIYLSDMSRCRPDSALAEKLEKGRWMLIPYETDEVSGTMIVAESFINAPDVTLPLEVSGWHAIYVGCWNPHYAYDNGAIVKVKLSDDPASYRISLRERHTGGLPPCVLQEVFFKNAELAGQDIIIGKMNGPMAQKACVAYIRLVPLSSEQVAVIQKDRARTDTRKLVATQDGLASFLGVESRTKEDILELVELYRYSDVGKVLWAVCYGEVVNYPSVTGVSLTDALSRVRLVEGSGTNPGVSDYKAICKSMEELFSKGIIPQQVLAEHVHDMGLKFDIMFRISIAGGLPPHRNENSFVVRHPEFRQVMRDGTPVEKASYAFPEVRALMLSIIREATQKFDVDGINLCFVRGPHFTEYEKPVLEDFQRKYGEDAREVETNDPRLLEVRATYMTDFIREARRILDDIGQQKGRRLELSIWAWPGRQNVWLGKTPIEEGLDIKGWIIEGLLDSFFCQEGVDPEDLELCKKHNCRFILFPGYRDPTPTTPKTVAEGYQKGADEIAIWDIDGEVPENWEWNRRIGHREEMEFWDKHISECRSIQVKKLAGLDAYKGLEAAVYSGG